MNRRRNRLFSYYSPPRVQMQAVRRAGQPAFMPRSANTAGAEASMGIDALCICCSLRKDSTARQGGRGCRLSLPTRRASPQSCAALWAAGGSMGSDAFYNARGLLWEIPRRRREEGAGSACQPAARKILWEAVRLVWAVACVRTAPRRRRELHAGSTRGAENPMGSSAFFIVHGASIEISAR